MLTEKYFVYIVTNKKNGTLYVGVTGNLPQRIFDHKSKSIAGFTKRYGLDQLVFAELHNDINAAIHREKRIKEWPRQWKINLIESINPEWTELNLHDYA